MRAMSCWFVRKPLDTSARTIGHRGDVSQLRAIRSAVVEPCERRGKTANAAAPAMERAETDAMLQSNDDP
jgi:hypothetical protein